MAMEPFTLERGKVKSHHVLLRMILQEMGDWCCTSTILDLKTIEERVKHEGESFLTISLPQFGKDFQKSLDQGVVDSTLFLNFKRRACLPAFLQGFTSQVFDIRSGVLLDTPNIDAIHAVFQVCNLLGKMELPCSDAREHAAMRKYVETEAEVRANDKALKPELLYQFEKAAHSIWRDVLVEMDKTIFNENIVPKHGPGATADKLRGNAKFNQLEWTHRLEEVFPHGDFLFPNWRHYDADRVTLLPPKDERPVRVVSVPKTLKTPRIIAIEPTCMQYVQQGIWESFRTNIERHDSLSVLVGFSDQIPNQEMAREGSLSGDLATLDLSEASDRVSNQLVRALLARHHLTREAVDACRSRKADIPGFGVLRLAKFASMGSALCFPIEAMVFMTIVTLAISKASRTPISDKFLSELVGKVRIYGDDIIVPVEYVHTVIEHLQAFGLVVNSDKSFWTGKFRESCGKEYFDGNDVSIVKLRQVFPASRQHVSELVSLVSTRNQLYKAGFWKTCEFLDNYIERLIPFPVVAETSPALGRHSFLGYETQRECPHLHRSLVRAYKVNPRSPDDLLSESGALLKFFLKRGHKPFAKDHLERAGRPRVVNIKLGWVPSY